MKVRNFLHRFALPAALLLAACLCFPAAADEAEISLADLDPEDVEEVTIEAPLISNPLPIDFTGGFEPQESGFQGEDYYEDPTIRVRITRKDVKKDYIQGHSGDKWTAEAWIVDIEIGDASQLRTAAAESFEKKTVMRAEDIADRVHAVVAFNADYYISRMDDGFHIRQGTFFRDKLKKRWDVLLIDEDGDFHPVHVPDRNTLSDTVDGKKVINAFSFGPILVEDGELVVDQMKNFTYLKPDEYYSRLAICQVGPLHYKVILTTMEQSYALGLPLKAFAQLCKDEGAQVAYNLDGGYSTTLYFHGTRLNNQYKVNFRDIPDIFYFASAWDGGNAE